MRLPAFLLLLAMPVSAQLRSASPASLEPPAPAHADLTAYAKGVQIYRCSIGESSPAWVFTAPEATLYETAALTGPAVGTHGAGPSWRWTDGSAILGKLVNKQPSADPKNIPALLLSTSSAPDTAPSGRLNGITYVRRSETVGGTAPAKGCDPKHFNQEIRVPYTATYTFYR